MNIAVLGSAGQLGRDLCPRLPGEVVPLTREHARPDPARSCARHADRSCAPTWSSTVPPTTSSIGPRRSRRRRSRSTPGACGTWPWCAATSVACWSTSAPITSSASTRPGARPTPRRDAPGPVSVYGLSKLAGEYLVRRPVPAAFRHPHLRAVRRLGQRRQGRQLRRDDAARGRPGEAAARGGRPDLHAELHRRCGDGDGRG